MGIQKQISWSFLHIRPGNPTVDGNISKLFNTGDSRPPKSFVRIVDRNNAQDMSAVIFGREAIANSLDASIAAQNKTGAIGLDYYFEEFSGSEADKYWDLLCLDQLAARANTPTIDRDKELGLSDSDCLTLGRKAPLRILTVVERGGGGMPGSLDDEDSVLVRALMNIGEAQTREGASGSYGFGKAAVAQASKPRILIVYTCSKHETVTDGVTRRLMGITYWGGHTFEGRRSSGWAKFGIQGSEDTKTLDDDEADQFAERLGLPVRDPSLEDDIGTTFMIIDPVFEPESLIGSVELFWWPLLQNTRSVKLDLTIIDYEGNVHTVQVDEDHPELGQFVTRFREAEKYISEPRSIIEDDRVVWIGKAGITSLERKNPESAIEGSLIAQMRSPLMVVSYDTLNISHPNAVGVFVSHESTNENLRRVEPAEHDKWLRQRVGGLHANLEDIRISKLVREEREQAINAIRGPEPEPVYGVSAFSQFFPGIDIKVARPKPPKPVGEKKQRLVRVNLVHQVDGLYVETERPTREYTPEGLLRVRAFVKFTLDRERAKKVNKEFLDATIKIGARIIEEGGGGEWLPSTVSQKVVLKEKKFKKVSKAADNPTSFEGTFKVGESFFFLVETEPYDPDWTVELSFDCDPWDVAEPVKINTKEAE